MINQTLNDRYRITALIGSGAMGTVYRAAEAQTGQEVAVAVVLMKKNRPASPVSRKKPDRPPQSATLRGASKDFRLFVYRRVVVNWLPVAARIPPVNCAQQSEPAE